MLFSGINQENCAKVSARIDAIFQLLMEKSEYRLEFCVAPMTELTVNKDIEEQPLMEKKEGRNHMGRPKSDEAVPKCGRAIGTDG